MSIVELLKREELTCRVLCGDVWLVWDETRGEGEWVVRKDTHKRQNRVVEVISTADEQEAVRAFLRESGEAELAGGDAAGK
jgi:hypothetical protein